MPAASSGELSFPRQYARTQRFNRGVPRLISVVADGKRVLFVRSGSGTDPVGRFWALDVASGEERLLVDPVSLLGAGDEQLSVAERARRERSREASSGIVGYATDRTGSVAAFALSSRLFVADTEAGGASELPAVGPVLDPRPDPTGSWVAYAGAHALHAVRIDGTDARTIAAPETDDVTWGLAEFVASEEMSRFRGFWWAPDGTALLVARVDEAPVQRWHIADPANPASPPVEVAYPASGTANATVSVHLLGLDGSRVDIDWDGGTHPYLITAHWSEHGDPLLLVMSRDQREAQVLAVDPGSGATRVLRELHDNIWLDVVPGVPAWLPGGRLLTALDHDGARRLCVDDTVVTPDGLQVSHVVSADGDGVVVAGTDEPTEMHLWRVRVDEGDAVTRLSPPGGYHAGAAGDGTVVVSRRTLAASGVEVSVLRHGSPVARIASLGEAPLLTTAPQLMRVGHHDLCVGIVLPRDHVAGTGLPVLMAPYGGPHHQEVITVHDRWLESQWLADQGFAVVVADGRGTGSRGREWDRSVHHEFASITLDDQVEALQAVAAQVPDLDTSRVAIRGWSYGGYLAALAVLRRPDVFHAAVAGAPPTDWRLYDTFYTERYLGHPDQEPAVYERNSLLGDVGAGGAGGADRLRRPLLIIHGLADDNVVAAHTLRLSSALLAAGAPHDVLPLSGVTHMTSQEVVAENLLTLQVEWLHRALAR